MLNSVELMIQAYSWVPLEADLLFWSDQPASVQSGAGRFVASAGPLQVQVLVTGAPLLADVGIR